MDGDPLERGGRAAVTGALSGRSRASAWGRVWGTAWIWGPALVVVLLAAPSIDFMLPAYHSHLGENYQPLRALRFFASPTTDFHKYGPLPNFLLAPGYAISLAVWWLSGTFTHPSSDFPYGFQQPLEQISFLLLQGRLLFLVIFVGLFSTALLWLRAATSNRTAIALAFLFCVGTNYCAVGYAANTRPDGPMFAFVAASLGLYVRIVYDGLTRARGVWLSILAVCAISAKEVAGPVYLLPYLGVGWLVWQAGRERAEERPALLRTVAATLAAGVGSYLLLNVVYAPQVWLVRMSHWLGGAGADSAVWGGVSSGAMSRAGFLLFLAQTFLNTLGPGGVVVVLAALGVLVVMRPRHWLLLLLPFASILGLGLLPLGYGSDYFTSVATVALIPPVAVGLAGALALAGSRGIRRTLLHTGLGVALSLNLLFATFAWHRLEGLFPRVVERALAGDPPGDLSVAIPGPHPHVPGKSRLAWLGYRFDPRSMQQIIDAPPGERPDRIYMSSGQLGFLEDALSQPARAAMLREEGLDLETWNGIESLGYRLSHTVVSSTPSWFFFDWMPAVDLWTKLSPVYVYERSLEGPPP